METKRLKITELETNTGQIEGLPTNPRQWRKDELDRLKKSLEETPELFEARGIIVTPHNGKYIVLGGNMRLAAATALMQKDVPCIIVPEGTPTDKLKEIVIKDNGAFGEWDFDALANEWDDLPLPEWGVPAWDADAAKGEQDAEAHEDDFDEEMDVIEVICKRGDIWQLGEHRLMCGDSVSLEDVKKLMGGGIADLLLTDPPYNVDYEGRTSDRLKIDNDKMDQANFRSFLTATFRASESVLKAGGAFYVWHGPSKSDVFIESLRSASLEIREMLIWNKNNMVLGRQDYQWKHEGCVYGWKDGAAHYFIDSRSETTVYEDAKYDFKKMKADEMRSLLQEIFSDKKAASVINCDKPSASEEHPTMKPVKLFGYLMRNSTRRGEIVLDTFGGSGTTLIAAEQLGRKARLMELDPHYCDVIIARWEKLTGRKAAKIA